MCLAERTIAYRAHLAGQGGYGVAMGIELGATEQLEDPLLHALRDHVLEVLGYSWDEEHLQQSVMPDELERDLPTLAG
jgi:hypothetical protein